MQTVGAISVMSGGGGGHFNNSELKQNGGFEADGKKLIGKYLSPFSPAKTRKVSHEEFLKQLEKRKFEKQAKLLY